MAKRKDRVVIDTNLWISFLLTSDLVKLDRFLENNLATLLFSDELLNEFVEVARRPKFRKYFTANDLQDLLLRIREKAEFIKVTSTTDACRDIKDNFLLALAIDGKATHVLTGDKDLLELHPFEGIQVLPIATYLGAAE